MKILKRVLHSAVVWFVLFLVIWFYGMNKFIQYKVEAATYAYSGTCSDWRWVGGIKTVAAKGCVQIRESVSSGTTWSRVVLYSKCASGRSGHYYSDATVYLTDRGNGHVKVTHPLVGGAGEFTPHLCGSTLASAWTLTYTSAGRVKHGHIAADLFTARNDRYDPATRLATSWLVF